MLRKSTVLNVMKIALPAAILFGLVIFLLQSNDVDAKKKTGPIVTNKVGLLLQNSF